jgi:hypothetical protein
LKVWYDTIPISDGATTVEVTCLPVFGPIFAAKFQFSTLTGTGWKTSSLSPKDGEQFREAVSHVMRGPQGRSCLFYLFYHLRLPRTPNAVWQK